MNGSRQLITAVNGDSPDDDTLVTTLAYRSGAATRLWN